MKRLVALMMCAVSLGAAAQFPSLPYNPDENGDMLIGVVDLQALLANYGQEFSSAVVSEDGESAIVFMGEMGYFECEFACEQLPGFWSVASPQDLVPIYDELNVGTTFVEFTFTWIDKSDFEPNSNNLLYPLYQGGSLPDNRAIITTQYIGRQRRCYCAASQVPRVEYDIIYAFSGNGSEQACSELQSMVNSKLDDGWMIHGTVQPDVSENSCFQTLWRWAE